MASLRECDSKFISSGQFVEDCSLYPRDYSDNADDFNHDDRSELKLLLSDTPNFGKKYEKLSVSVEDGPILIQMIW